MVRRLGRVVDAATLFDAIADPIERTPQVANATMVAAVTGEPKQLRIAYSLEPSHPTSVSDTAREAVAQTVQLLRDLGHRVTEHDPDYGNLRPLILPRLLRGIYDDLRHLDDARKLEGRSRRIARAGRFISARRLVAARDAEVARAARINEVFAEHDVLITPVIAQPAPLAESWSKRGVVQNAVHGTPWIAYTQVWNFTGQPCGGGTRGVPLRRRAARRPTRGSTR